MAVVINCIPGSLGQPMEVVEPEDVVEAEPLLVTPQGLRERRRHIDHPQLAALGQALLLGGRVCWISPWRPW